MRVISYLTQWNHYIRIPKNACSIVLMVAIFTKGYDEKAPAKETLVCISYVCDTLLTALFLRFTV